MQNVKMFINLNFYDHRNDAMLNIVTANMLSSSGIFGKSLTFCRTLKHGVNCY